MAVAIWQEVKPVLWWFSNAVVLIGSGAYTYVQKQDLDRNFSSRPRLGSTEDKQSLLPLHNSRKEGDEDES